VILLPAEERLRLFRAATEEARWEARRLVTVPRPGDADFGKRIVRGGAPTFPTTIAWMKNTLTKNTFTGPNSILDTSNRGPFQVDWFNSVGAQWEMEALGLAGVAAATTPTIIMRIAFGVASADPLGTSLAASKTFTAISGMGPSVPWYLYAVGRTVLAQGATSTMRVQGVITQQFEIAAAGNNVAFMPASGTAPSDVTTDLSSSVYLDLQVTFSVSNVANQFITEMYRLTSVATG
jgi:hypothetical protein